VAANPHLAHASPADSTRPVTMRRGAVESAAGSHTYGCSGTLACEHNRGLRQYTGMPTLISPVTKPRLGFGKFSSNKIGSWSVK
jgi:hypothetical protein